jgi:hypothetical protein
MKPVYFIAIFSLYFLSCTHKQKTSNKQDTIGTKQQHASIFKIDEDTISVVPDTTKISLSYNTVHFFSDIAKKDNFSITLYSKNIIGGVVVFKISNHKNQQIFEDTFPASDLLGDQADVLDIKQQKDTITTRMAEFLNEKNFTSPAIDNTEKFEDLDSTDKNSWETIKADHTSIGFIYSHGYESTYGIAYSKSKRKVISIFYSD